MNVYVVETAKRLAALGVEIEIFTRATSSDQPPVVPLIVALPRYLAGDIQLGGLMQAAQARAQSETPAGGNPVALEQAGGAAPGEPEQTAGQQILAARGPQTPARSLWGW